jgi:tetratricopeptide (TPR) repeat protein
VLARVDASSPVIDEATGHADAASPSRRAAVYRVLARLFDGWDAPERAFLAWSKVHEVDAGDAEAVSRLIELTVVTGRFDQAMALLSREVEKEADPDRAVALLRRIATIATEHAKDPDRAAEALTSALDLAPKDRSVAEDLSEALSRAGRHGEQTVVLRLLASTAPDDEARIETLKRLARLLSETLHDEPEALAVWEQIAGAAPDVVTLEELAEEARADSDPNRLDVLLRRLIRRAPTPDQRVKLVLERAELLADELDRARDAMAVLVEATSGDARTHLPAISRLESLAETLGDQATLARALELEVELVPDSVQRVVLARIVDLHEGPLDDPARAVSALERWEKLRPGDTEPRLRLIPHLVNMRAWDALLERLDRLISLAPDRHGELVDLVVSSVEDANPSHDETLAALFLDLPKRAASPSQRCALLVRGAELFEAIGANTTAFDAAAAAIAIAGPDEALLSVVDRLAVDAGRERERDAIYERFTGRGATPALRKMLVLRHARHLGEAGRFRDAVERLLQVSALAPTDDELLDALEDVAKRASRTGDVVTAHYERAKELGPGAPSVGLLLRAVRASYADERGFDTLRLFARAVELAGGEPRLLDLVESVAEDIGRPALEQMMTVYEGAARTEPVAERRAALLVRGARVVLAVAPDAKQAGLRLIEEALGLAPTNEVLFDMIEAVAAESGLVERLDEHLEKTIEATMSDAVAASFLRRRAQMLHKRLGKPSEAADTYLRLWALRPSDPDVFRHLRVCLLETGRIHELISAAERELSNLDDEGRRIPLMREIARLWEEDAGNKWEAVDAWKRVLAHVPGDTVATDAVARLSRSKSSSPRD